MKMTFGLTGKDIEVVEKIIDDFGACDYAWEKIGKEIGWHPPSVANWYIKYLLKKQSFSWIKVEDKLPTTYGKYWVYRKAADKIHREVWNGTGWAYNNNTITHWMVISRPID